MENTTITPGVTTFPYHHADSNPLWRVVKKRGGDTWECVVTDDSPDYAGTRKVFGGEEIRRAVASAAMWDDMANDHVSWWQSRKIGETVHYDNGFGQYVRGRIVWEVTEQAPEGHNVMVPEALVGNWRSHDLPHYNAAGYLVESYHVRQIRDGKTMQPNYSNMVEARGVRPGKGEDPRGREAIDLTPPAITDEQTEAGRLSTILAETLAILNAPSAHGDGAPPYSAQVRAKLIQARNALNAAKLLA